MKLVVLLASALLLVGCSSTQVEETTSPAEKRNNYDACLIDYKQNGESWWDINAAEQACVYLLK